MHEEWLSIIMQHVFSEIYLLDPATLRIREANAAACKNLQFDCAELGAMTLLERMPGLARDDVARALHQFERSGTPESLETVALRRDGSRYPLQLRLMRSLGGPAVLIAIGNDISVQRNAAAALGQSEARFQTIVAQTPGLVFQFLLRNNVASFLYLSEGCQALLGVSAAELSGSPERFDSLILNSDRASFYATMHASADTLSPWNWAGRIWIDAWHDVKWINLRASPHRDDDGGVRWDGIMSNITQSKLEELDIKQSHAGLAELAAHSERVLEQERTRIAREVHDELGGNLTAIKMALALVMRRLPYNDPALAAKAAYVDELVDRTIEATHRIALDLRPSMLDLGIVAALEWQTGELQKQLAIPCTFSTNKKEVDLPDDQASALFRIFQEALTNIAKHAGASRVVVRLCATPHQLILRVRDNGRGINLDDRLKPASFGIRGMMERARALGGSVLVERAPGGGANVLIKIARNRLPTGDNGNPAPPFAPLSTDA